MSMYSQYKSNSGYHIGDDGIDSYGVNHKTLVLEMNWNINLLELKKKNR